MSIELYHNTSRQYFIVLKGALQNLLHNFKESGKTLDLSPTLIAQNFGARAYVKMPEGGINLIFAEGKLSSHFKPQNKFGFSSPKTEEAKAALASVSKPLPIDELADCIGEPNFAKFNFDFDDTVKRVEIVCGFGIPNVDFVVGREVVGIYFPDAKKAATQLATRFTNIKRVFEVFTPDQEKLGLYNVSSKAYKAIVEFKHWGDPYNYRIEDGILYLPEFVEFDTSECDTTDVVGALRKAVAHYADNDFAIPHPMPSAEGYQQAPLLW